MACWWVMVEVGIPIMLVSLPWRKRSPIRATAWQAVDPVPRPRTIPDLTNSTALYAAIFFNSSWVRITGDGEGGVSMRAVDFLE